jgi:hypothetical protein
MLTSLFVLETLGGSAARVVRARYAWRVKLVTESGITDRHGPRWPTLRGAGAVPDLDPGGEKALVRRLAAEDLAANPDPSPEVTGVASERMYGFTHTESRSCGDPLLRNDEAGPDEEA